MKLDNNDIIVHTRNEIDGQPDLWVNTINFLKRDSIRIWEFLKPLLEKKNLNIILTGAGSSAFIGQTVEFLFRIKPGMTARAISTTTLVTHFKNYIDPEVPLLLISFARSGNSPESIAAVDMAENYCKHLHHIAVTCNNGGMLAKKISNLPNGLTLVLPPESEDQGLAMTGSFTAMTLGAIYLSQIAINEDQSSVIEDIADSANEMIQNYSTHVKKLSSKSFDRIVFLGSGPLQGIAEESHLKVQELTDGYIVGKFDSFLGFRHGPKAVINDQTVLVFLFSPDENVFRYEIDLVQEILREDIAMHCIGVFCNAEQAAKLNLDLNIVFNMSKASQKSDFNLLLYVLPAQILGFYKSKNLGLNPDSPSENNTISRVVQGVKIYS